MALLRAATRAAKGAAAGKLPQSLTQASSNSIPFVPVDWVFRFFPRWTRDKVRFLVRYYQISFFMGLGGLYFFAHPPYQGDHYDHFEKSWMYEWTESRLKKTGQLEENLRVKVHHFYPQTE
ncbi:unnamed protein product [Effrenium voratum]|nr:unnamed protein product [Effrenium voratum]